MIQQPKQQISYLISEIINRLTYNVMNYTKYLFLIVLIGLTALSPTNLRASEKSDEGSKHDKEFLPTDSAIPHVIGHTLSAIIKITLQKKVINPYLEPYTNNRFIAFINNHSESLLEIAEGFWLGAIRMYTDRIPEEKNLLLKCCMHGFVQALFAGVQEAIVIAPSAILAPITKKYHHSPYYIYGTRVLRALARIGIQSIPYSISANISLLAPGTLYHRIAYQTQTPTMTQYSSANLIRILTEKKAVKTTIKRITKKKTRVWVQLTSV